MSRNLNFEKNLVGYCGVYCRKCDYYTGSLRDAARRLLTFVERHGELRKAAEMEGMEYDTFARFLRWLSTSELCLGCRAGGGWEECPIRRCAVEKGVEGCYACPEYPCILYEEHPQFKEFVETIKAVGLDKYVEESLR